MRGGTRMKMDADACDNQFDGRMAMKTQPSSAELFSSSEKPVQLYGAAAHMAMSHSWAAVQILITFYA